MTRRAWLALLTLLGLRRPAEAAGDRVADRMSIPPAITELERGDVVYPAHHSDQAARRYDYVVVRRYPWRDIGMQYDGGPRWRRRVVARYGMWRPCHAERVMPLIDGTWHLEADRERR